MVCARRAHKCTIFVLCDTDRISKYWKFISRTHRSYFRSYFLCNLRWHFNKRRISTLFGLYIFFCVPLTKRLMVINYMKCFLVRDITKCYASRSSVLHHWMNFYANFNIKIYKSMCWWMASAGRSPSHTNGDSQLHSNVFDCAQNVVF